MIIEIEAKGFRSLTDFSMKLNPGLNILVGPNGSGKTNVVEFLEFLSHYFSSNAQSAIASCGGATSVFCQEQLNTPTPTFSFSVGGVAPVYKGFMNEEINGEVAYRYSATIALTKNVNPIVITKEDFSILNFSTKKSEKIYLPAKRTKPLFGLTVKRNANQPEIQPSITFRYEDEKIITNLLRHRNRNKHPTITSLMDDFQTELAETATHESILSSFMLRMSSFVFVSILRDLHIGYVYNISPEKAKQPDDIAQGPGIKNDGTGTAVTLQRLQEAYERKTDHLIFDHSWIPSAPKRLSPYTLKQIKELVSLINPSINDVSVKVDLNTGKYVGYAKIQTTDDSEIEIPFSKISDGTIKWLSLVSAILTEAPIAAIEEPENFLHPKMQTHFIDIARSFSNADAAYPKSLIISTHSETLLDACEPEELMLVHYLKGSTIVSRPVNPQEIYSQIVRTGFGLGQFYVANAIK